MKPQLRRSMGLVDVALFFLIASTNLQWVAASAAAGPSSFFAWVLGCVAFFAPLGVVVVCLSVKYPKEGGMYVWVTQAFGPYAGFITAWSYWFSTLAYFPGLLYFSAGAALYATGTHTASPAYFMAFAAGALVIGTALNVLGLQTGKRLVNAAAVCRALVIALLVAFGAFFSLRYGIATHVTSASFVPKFGVRELIFLSVIALAFVGPEALPFMAEEVREPQRSIPRGLALAAPAIVAIYVLGAFGLMAIAPPARIDALYGVTQGFSVVATRFGGTPVIVTCVALVLVSCLGSLTAWIGANARLPFVAGIDRYLPSAFGRLHPRWKSPVVSLYVQLAGALVLAVLGQSGTTVKGAYDILVACTILGTMVPFLLMFAAGIKLLAGNAFLLFASCAGFSSSLAALVLSAFPSPDDPSPAVAAAKIVGLNVAMLTVGSAFYAWRAHRTHALAREAQTT